MICDGCDKPISNTAAPLAFIPLRGGLRLVNTNDNGTTSVDVDKELHFHAPECLGAWAAKLKPAVKAEEKKAAK